MDVTQRVAHSELLKRLPERLWPWRRRGAGEARVAAKWDAGFVPVSEALREACGEEVRQRQLLETLVSGLSHRVNNGLHGIVAHADCIARSASATQARSAQGVVASAEGLAHLTRDLARAACEVPVTPEVHNLTELVNEWAAPLRQLGSPAIEVTIEPSCEAVPVSVDSARLWEALAQLMRNAAEAYDGRSGAVEVRTGTWAGAERLLAAARPVINIRAGAYGYVEVADQGQGIDDAHLARVFDPFFSTRFIGRGLGLPVVVNLMRCMHGLILLESTKGVGTRVRLLLPLVSPASDARDHTGVLKTGRCIGKGPASA